MRSIVCAAIAALSLTACAPSPQTASIIAQPKTPVGKTRTNFSEALRCMDGLFRAYGVQDILVTSDGLPDATGKVSVGSRDMMITALSKMSATSGAFRFVNLDRFNARGRETPGLIAQTYYPALATAQAGKLPRYEIKGAITAADGNVARDGGSAGVGLPSFSLGYSEDQQLSVVSVDMNMFEIIGNTNIPGMTSANTITVVSTGSGADAEGIINNGALFVDLQQDRSEGMGAATRTLVELGMIEMMGKLAKVPYSRCLQIEATDPLVTEQARRWYDQMTPTERVEAAQRGLTDAGYYAGAVTGAMDASFREAVNRYKSDRALIADGRVDYDLYYQLVVENRPVAPTQSRAAGRNNRRTLAGDALSGPATQAAAEQRFDASGVSGRPEGETPVGLTLGFADGRTRVRNVGTPFAVRLSVARPAEVYCYYEFGPGPTIMRVFPNRFQPDARVAPGRDVQVPGAGAGFDLKPLHAGVDERLACVAKEGGYRADQRPDVALTADLTPIGVRSLNTVLEQHRAADVQSSGVRTLSWSVR